MRKSIFTIRKKKHAKHPQIIIDANRIRFSSLGITHSKGKRKSRNKKLFNNPNKEDNKPAYITRRIIEDFKFNYSKAFKNYQLSNEDIDMLIEFLRSKKKQP